MKDQRRFTSAAADRIRWLLDRTRAASRADQKVLRQEIRDLGFTSVTSVGRQQDSGAATSMIWFARAR